MKKNIRNILILFSIIAVAVIIFILYKDGLLTKKQSKQDEFKINPLNEEERPFVFDKIASLTDPGFAADKDGIILYNNESYNPNQIANVGLFYLDTFRKTGDKEFLKSAQKYAAKLKEISFTYKNALYLPYNFDFAMHGNQAEVLTKPWYSGMAQGEALSLFVRLYEITHEKEYLTTADSIFKSYTNLRKNSSPWTVFVDENDYFWIEEYPEESVDHTLNGFIFSLYGVYDYYQLTKNNQAKKVFQSSLSTIKHYAPEFRNPGGVSFYCLKHKVQSENYHEIHIKEFNMLYAITGDSFFKEMADNFYNDHN